MNATTANVSDNDADAGRTITSRTARAPHSHICLGPLSVALLPTPFRQSAPVLIFPRIVAGGQTPNGVASVAPSNEGEVACAHLSLLPLPSRRGNLCAHGCLYVCKYTCVCLTVYRGCFRFMLKQFHVELALRGIKAMGLIIYKLAPRTDAPLTHTNTSTYTRTWRAERRS